MVCYSQNCSYKLFDLNFFYIYIIFMQAIIIFLIVLRCWINYLWSFSWLASLPSSLLKKNELWFSLLLHLAYNLQTAKAQVPLSLKYLLSSTISTLLVHSTATMRPKDSPIFQTRWTKLTECLLKGTLF